jgi:hypothetical protein
MVETPPDRPTRVRLEKLIALANDDRGEPMTRRVAKRKLARYAKFYPSLLTKKTSDDSKSQSKG